MKWFWSKFRFYKCIFEYKPLWCHWIWFWLISLQAPATKEQQRRQATLAVIFFTPIQEKAFFNLNLWIEKGKEIIIFYGKYAQAVWPPLMTSTRPWWPPATPCDLSIKLMVGTKIGLILEKFAVQFWILAFFPVQDQQLKDIFFHLFLFVVFALKKLLFKLFSLDKIGNI